MRAPVGAELVVFLPFGGITEDFVSFVDLLEFFFGALLVLGDIRMVFARELAKRLFDVSVARVPRNAEALVVIFILNSHG